MTDQKAPSSHLRPKGIAITCNSRAGTLLILSLIRERPKKKRRGHDVITVLRSLDVAVRKFYET